MSISKNGWLRYEIFGKGTHHKGHVYVGDDLERMSDDDVGYHVMEKYESWALHAEYITVNFDKHIAPSNQLVAAEITKIANKIAYLLQKQEKLSSYFAYKIGGNDKYVITSENYHAVEYYTMVLDTALQFDIIKDAVAKNGSYEFNYMGDVYTIKGEDETFT